MLFQANATLAFLEKITEEDKVARCFSRSPLSTRAAAAVSLVAYDGSSKVSVGVTLCSNIAYRPSYWSNKHPTPHDVEPTFLVP